MQAQLGFSRRNALVFVMLVVAGMLMIEGVNTARKWWVPSAKRVFPHGYVSKGVWSFGSLFQGSGRLQHGYRASSYGDVENVSA